MMTTRTTPATKPIVRTPDTNATQPINPPSTSSAEGGPNSNVQDPPAPTPTITATTSSAATSAPAQRPQSRPGGVKGRKNWTPSHMRNLLNLCSMYLPRGRDEWEEIAKVFNTNLPQPYQRTEIQLRDKYHSIARARGTAGNPQLHEFAIKAQQIEELIKRKSQTAHPLVIHNTEGSGSPSLDHGDGDDDDDGYDHEEKLSASTEREEALIQPPAANESDMMFISPSTSSAAAALPFPRLAPPPPQSSSSSSSPSSSRITGKRKRDPLDPSIRDIDVLDREEKEKQDSLEKAMVMMAAAITALASNAQTIITTMASNVEAAERRHEQLMAALLSKKE